tara:strand:- start:164 stop:556 length:393 start_codon:yes stop_codon:yes gene_type:complete
MQTVVQVQVSVVMVIHLQQLLLKEIQVDHQVVRVIQVVVVEQVALVLSLRVVQVFLIQFRPQLEQIMQAVVDQVLTHQEEVQDLKEVLPEVLVVEELEMVQVEQAVQQIQEEALVVLVLTNLEIQVVLEL